MVSPNDRKSVGVIIILESMSSSMYTSGREFTTASVSAKMVTSCFSVKH